MKNSRKSGRFSIGLILPLLFTLGCSPKVGCPAIEQKNTHRKEEANQKRGTSQLFDSKMRRNMKGAR